MFRTTPISCKSAPTIRVSPSVRIPLRVPQKSRPMVKGFPQAPRDLRVIKRNYATVVVPRERCQSQSIGPYEQCGMCQWIIDGLDRERTEHNKLKEEYEQLQESNRRIMNDLVKAERESHTIYSDLCRLKVENDDLKQQEKGRLIQLEGVLLRIDMIDEKWKKVASSIDLNTLGKVVRTKEFQLLMKQHAPKV